MFKSVRDYFALFEDTPPAAAPTAAPAAAPAAEPAVDPARAQYDKFQADDAKKAAIEKIKKLAAIPTNSIPRLGWAIDPNSGIIYYNSGDSESGGPGAGKAAPYGEAGKFWDFNSPAGANSEAGQLGSLVRQAGLEVIPVAQKGLFGSSNVAAVDPNKLKDIDKVVTPAPTPAPTPSPTVEPSPTPEPVKPPVTPPNNPPQVVKPNQNVLYIQQTLKRLGADLGTTGPNKDGVDGIMGPKTQAMMKKYNIDASGRNIAKPNPNAPATGTQSNAVTTAAAAGNRAQDVETGAGAFTGNTVQMGRDAAIAKQVANAPKDPKTGLPVDWPKWSLNQRRVYNNLEREKARTGAQPVVPANQTPPQPGAVKEGTGYDELQRIMSIVSYR